MIERARVRAVGRSLDEMIASATRAIERIAARKALQRTRGNRAKAALHLGISEARLYRILGANVDLRATMPGAHPPPLRKKARVKTAA